MPGIPFPAFCTNPACGTFFFADRVVGVPDGSQARINVTNFGVGPCPKCGDFGAVPDGVYSLVDATIRDPHEAERVRRFLAVMERHIRFPTSLPELMNDLSAEGIKPSVWRPKNVTEAVALIGAVFMLLSFAYGIYKDHRADPPPQRASGEMKEVIEMILDRTIPPITQQAPSPTSSPTPQDPPTQPAQPKE